LQLWFASGAPLGGAFTNADEDVVPPLVLRMLFSLESPRLLLVFPNSSMAESQFSILRNSRNDFPLLREDFHFLPELASGSKTPSPDMMNSLSRAIETAAARLPGVFFTSGAALLSGVPEEFATTPPLILEKGADARMDFLCSSLVRMNYADEFETGAPGEFSRRGGILDIYSPSESSPARVEFFGDRIEEIRLYDPLTQRSVGAVQRYRLSPVFDFSGAERRGGMLKVGELFIRNPARTVTFHPESCRAHLRRFFGEDGEMEFSRLIDASADPLRVLDIVESGAVAGEDCSTMRFSQAEDAGLAASRDEALDKSFGKVSRLISDSFSVVVGTKDEDGVGHLSEMLSSRGIGPVEVARSSLPNSFVLEGLKLAFISEDDLLALPFRRIPRLPDDIRRAGRMVPGEGGEFFSDFDEGDFVVHNDYGIGVFRGMVSRNFGGIESEALKIEFADEVMTYTDIHRSDLVSKYSGAGKMQPRLSVVGRRGWGRAKLLARRGAAEFASGLLTMQAARMDKTGLRLAGDRREERLFEKKFPYTETPDQRISTDEIFKDMESSYPMDRLLCGDAGYGKTEVAMRAAFRAVASGKQVAVLVPTTVLAQQHYYSFTERFSEYPVVVEMLSRFRTHREQGETLRRLAEGSIDIIVGTHRLLQKDIAFKDLGLLVIDEEQRFGVEHKENFKRMREKIDVLSMSATPIPRTLYMAMTGIRDLSTISTPPVERLPVLTYVSRFDRKVVSDAVNVELERGGQVFFLHNRVKSMPEAVERLAKIAPGARIGIAHGQMEEEELEQEMLSFLQGRTQILCCTTIIESGIDVPNANTLIVERADCFGLAELYQLRGRVGRSGRQGYAYFLLPPHLHLTSNARERIAAVKRHSELGAGFRIAMRDLEIRGSGNIIGTEQSGYINAVGFELYCHYLRMAAAELRGEKTLNFETCDISLDFMAFGRCRKPGPAGIMEAFIPQDYVESDKLRCKFHRRIALADSESKLDSILSEIEDRFGKPPAPVINLLLHQRLRITLVSAGYNRLRCSGESLEICEIRSGRYMLPGGRPPRLKSRSPGAKLDEISGLLRGNPLARLSQRQEILPVQFEKTRS